MSAFECVSEPDLRAFLLGLLPEPRSRVVAEHLEGCPECEATAERLDRESDPILRVLRQAVRAAHAGSRPGLSRIAEY